MLEIRESFRFPDRLICLAVVDMANYIKIDRRILDWEWYKNINTKVLFLHMLLKAYWKDTRIEGKQLERGSFISSIKNLSFETSLTENEVRTAILHLKTTGEITSEGTNKNTVFTIKNYDSYQTINEQNHNQTTNNPQPINKPLTTNEEYKELEEGKEKNDRNYLSIITHYNAICKSYPRIVKMSDKRRKALSARMNQGYTEEDFKRLFELAENSGFLKGDNDRDWSADFDWLITDKNMPKVLEEKYQEKHTPRPSTGKGKKPNRFHNLEEHGYDYDKMVWGMMNEQEASDVTK